MKYKVTTFDEYIVEAEDRNIAVSKVESEMPLSAGRDIVLTNYVTEEITNETD